MAKSPMFRGLRSGFGKLAMVSGCALILVMFALPAFALSGDQPATTDSAVATPLPADPQSSTSPAVAPAPSGMAFMHQDYMLNWGPERQRLADKGLTFNFFYITDAFGDPRRPEGARDTFNNWNRIRGTVDVDFGKFSSAKGLNFHVTGLWQNGSNMGNVIGSIANPSGLVSFHQFRVDSIWLQQKFGHDKVIVTAGLLAAQDFYGLQEYGGSFLIEPLDYNFGNMGNVRASYDPSSGPGAELKIAPSKKFYVKTAWIMPSSNEFAPSDPLHTTHPPLYATGFNYQNGSFGSTWDTEVGFYTDPDAPTTRKSYPGIIKVGVIYNGGRDFPDYKAGKLVSGNYTVYFQANQPIYRVAAGSNRGLDMTFGVNTGAQNKSQVPTEFTAGLIFHGPIPHRDKDSLNFGFVYSKIGSDFNHAANALVPGSGLDDEKAYEVNYKLQLAPWLLIQPTYQYYANVGGRQKGAAGLAGLRLQTTF
ncbi:MAG TPA: carbohydrate porin [Candidatus Saccharimonadales bacterium]|nr:carbohydrate porin [Candidatus Saccharimonadales bacterium]